ncbi:GNAT family N-acetyltransferase [Frondihabitans cladoniiphilus]|uniref:N-acetyltransferase domain-containing protein n=1 Tax=Frondihabitans cladoniiphilus TaxID=715785 RepID=A0ABP8W1P2_9MICO
MSETTASTTPGVRVERVEWDDPRAVALREAMEFEMGARYAGRDADSTPDKEEALHRALAVDPAGVFATILVVDESTGTPLGHAALRDLRGEWEMKRVIVAVAARGRGIGALLMSELDRAAREGGAARIILQTGDRQPEAVRLYERSGYTPIPVYPPYIDTIPFSLCYEKVLA